MAKLNLSADYFNKTNKIYLHIQSDDTQALLNIKKGIFPKATAAKNNEGERELTYSLPLKVVDSFLNSGFITKLYNFFRENHYEVNMNEQQFSDDIETARKSVPNPKQLEKAIAKRDNLLERFFQQYNDEEVKREIAKLAQNIKINCGDEKEYKYAILSYKNKLLAYAQKPDCTYIASQKTWRKYFKRRIKANAFPIYIIAGNNTHKFDDDFASQESGLSRLQASQNSHKLVSYDRLAKYGNTNPTAFFVTVYYDYSDTEPYDANEDSFNDDTGLESNLTGDYNDKFKELSPTQDGETDDIRNNIRDKVGATEIEKKASFAFDNIIDYCQRHSEEYNSVLIMATDKDKTEGITEVLREMFRVIYERLHDKKLQDEKVNVSTCFVLAAMNIANNSMLDYMATNGNKFNQKELLNMYSQCCEVINIMNGLKEDIFHKPTFKEFLNALNVTLDTVDKESDSKDKMNQLFSDETNESIKMVKENIISLMKRIL